MTDKSSLYGLIGRKLGHSWSREIHERLGSSPYELWELEPEEVASFIHKGTWKGINVTIPYKKNAAELADEQSARVTQLGVANTLIRRSDGSIFAENTDVTGFGWMLEHFFKTRFDLSARDALDSKEVLVLGTGGAAQAVSCALSGVGARVYFISRHGEDTYATLLERHSHASLIVNTTPVGMYPNCPDSPLDATVLSEMNDLLGVLDVVYNPIRTGLILQAERLNIPAESGLCMLVAQAVHASELFQGRQLDESMIETIVHDLKTQTQNISLIGMPGSGKTTAGRRLARLLGRPFVDLDDACAVAAGMPVADYITAHGEQVFRKLETEILADYGKRSGLVIACGGGVVTQPHNYELLRQNSFVVMLDRPLEELSLQGRPVSQAKGIEQLAHERMDLYRSWSDTILTCTGSPDGDANALMTLISS